MPSHTTSLLFPAPSLFNGIDASKSYVSRPALLRALDAAIHPPKATASNHRVLLVTAPPGAGKTSALTLFAAFNSDDTCAYVSCIDTEEEIGGAIAMLTARTGLRAVMLDDADGQASHTGFWTKLIKHPSLVMPGVTFIVVSSRVLTGSAAAEWKSLPRLDRRALLLPDDDARMLLRAKDGVGLSSAFKGMTTLMHVLIKRCQGLVGALRMSVALLNDHFPDSVSSEQAAISFYLSFEVLEKVGERCFSTTHRSPAGDGLRQLISHCTVKNTDASLPPFDDSDREALEQLERTGVLVESEEEEGDWTFTSPMAHDFYLSTVFFAERARRSPATLEALLTSAVSALSAYALRRSCKSGANFFDIKTFQASFLANVAQRTTKRTVLSTNLSAVFPSENLPPPEEIDLLVGHPRGNWGIQLIVRSDGAADPVDRFATTYAALACTDHAIVSVRLGAPSSTGPHRVVFAFKEGFNSCDVYSSADQPAKSLDLQN